LDDAASNWPDMREGMGHASGDAPVYMSAWCHGAPGIGLARRALRNLLPSYDISRALRVAERTTLQALRRATGRSLAPVGLCHGIAGLVECVRSMAADRTETRQLRVRSLCHANDVLAERASVADPVDPSLMLGAAGLGYAALREHDSRLPSILLPGLDALEAMVC
jgi:lantibiotic modifying enzyme